MAFGGLEVLLDPPALPGYDHELFEGDVVGVPAAVVGQFAGGVVVAHQEPVLGYSLQAPSKTGEGESHPDRDAQFCHLAERVNDHLEAGDPVISVDTKKKELVGSYDNAGVEYQPAGEPVEVNDHDFPEPGTAKAVPYGVYDLTANNGWVSVGDDGDTAAFAVATIERWWNEMGRVAYPDTNRLMITADAGGSNSYRSRLWKRELAALANRANLTITICHFPPGTSKWNKIEHRMFNHITLNWRGRPLTTYDTIVNLIANTTTTTGLTINADRDTGHYPTGIKIPAKEIKQLQTTGQLTPHNWHGDWNYTIHPTPTPKQPTK